MTTRAQDLIAAFIEANDALIKTVEALTREEWRLQTAEEGWPVGVVAHHLGTESGVEPLKRILNGDLTPFWADSDEVDALNAQHARDFASCTKEETLGLLRRNTSHVAKVLGALTDEQLKVRCEPVGGWPVTLEQFIVIMMPNHVVSHHQSILRIISQNATP